MRVASSVRAGWLVLDGSNNPEHTASTPVPIYPEPIGTIQPGQRLRLRVTGVTGLARFIHHMVLLTGRGGVANPAFLVEDANLVNAGLSRDRLDRLIKSAAVVAQHVIRRALLDDVTD